MESDPILREVYRMKDTLRRDTGGDVGKLFDMLHDFAKRHPERMVGPQQVLKGKRRVRSVSKP